MTILYLLVDAEATVNDKQYEGEPTEIIAPWEKPGTHLRSRE